MSSPTNELIGIRTQRAVHFTSHDDVEIADFPADNTEEYAMQFLCHWTRAQFFETIAMVRVRVNSWGGG